MFPIEQALEYLVHFLVWPTFFMLALALFRIRLQQYVLPIVVSTCILAPTTALLQASKLIYLITIIQPLVFLLCLMVVFRFKFFHSIIMLGLVYIYNIFLEVSYNVVVAQFDYEKFLQISKDEYIMQGVFMAIINYLTIYIIIKARWGFTFISPRISKIRSGTLNIQNKLYLSAIVIIFPLSMIGLSLYLWSELLVVVLSATSIILAIVIHFSYKRELLD
ncbi:hypothetical protein OB236_21365 [Paenibacillus sp. WQ 127069]|uniref:Uncharacterized protein n=1 Tax=Paenibacillus baimaensis TaxID=2982185 RepID=A0ABT2UJ55_9BACL|nr:hypothetical protein [Paenibacillus sp. WQ 127069]MCU6794663.1 hypothetical protein [Paenibacillus sp. WQ 127069]